MSKIRQIILASSLILFSTVLFFSKSQKNNLPTIAIANYGPHASLETTINSIKEELDNLGLSEGKNIHIEVSNVNFDPTLIGQMISKLKYLNPKVLVTLTTPVTQNAKNLVKDIPIVFTAITDPLEAKIIPDKNITGVSDLQNFDALMEFIKHTLPTAKSIGVLYSTSEANDAAMIRMLKESAKKYNMDLVDVAIDQSRDIPLRMQQFRGKVDAIYVGMSGPIQPSLPVIATTANSMGMPIINADSDAVKNHQVFASVGVNYQQIGKATGQIIHKILKGSKPEEIEIVYPKKEDHLNFISKKVADKLNISLPEKINNIQIVE